MPPVPSQKELDRRKIVGVHAETVTDVTSTDFPGHYPGENHEWNIQKFKDNFQVRFHKNAPYDASFSLISLDASIANAFRRILIAEIPSLAIEFVFVHNNTSIVADEVLAHRLGLIPLTASTTGLNWLRWFKKPTDEDPEGSSASDYNTIVLKMKKECTWKEGARKLKGETDPNKLYEGSNVYARDIVWEPVGRQNQFFPTPDGVVRAVNPGILIAKMRPGQAIDVEMHCIKGIGHDHAKFSPVATASYRLLPTINIVKPIIGADAKKFARCFPKGVIGLDEVTEESSRREGSGYEGQAGEKKAVVKNTFKDTVSRECLRHEEFEGKVKLGRIRDHFIFSVESTGQYESDLLFLESVKVLKAKCQRMKRGLADIIR